MLVLGTGNSDRLHSGNITTNAAIVGDPVDIRNTNSVSVQLITTGPTGLTAASATMLTDVVAATTANGTLASAFENGDTIDGVALATGNRILIKNQTAGAANGVYTVNASGAPTRATDSDTGAEILGKSVTVTGGTVNAGLIYSNTNETAPTLGTTPVTYALTNADGVTGTWKVEVSNSIRISPPETLVPEPGAWTDITADFDPAIPASDGTGQNWPVNFNSIPFRHLRFTFTPTNGTTSLPAFPQSAYAHTVGKSYGN